MTTATATTAAETTATEPTATEQTATEPWILSSGEPRRAATVPPGVEYHRVYAGEKRRILRGILAIVLLLAGLVIFPTGLGVVARMIDETLGRASEVTPLTHLSGMLGLALLIPWSMLIQRMLYRVPGASLHSVAGRFRFHVLGKALLVFGPLWVLMVGVWNFLPGQESPWTAADLAALLLVTLLVTPLQAAGEEYGIRGLMFRVLGSWTRGSTAGLVLGVIVTSVVFTGLHGTNDPYIIVWYLSLWIGLAIITWRTGGIEIAIVLHAVLNTVSFLSVSVLRVDLADQDRSAGAGQPFLLSYAAVVILTTAIIWWWTRRSGPARTPAA